MTDELYKIISEEERKGNICFLGIGGIVIVPLDEFIENQDAEGILYDLNRDKLTIMTVGDERRSVNDYAVNLVITELKRRLDEKEKQN